MQVYAAAIVIVAMRTAQNRIAREADLAPEQISPAMVFPRVAAASISPTYMKLACRYTWATNPRVPLREPAWNTLPEHRVPSTARVAHGRTSPGQTTLTPLLRRATSGPIASSPHADAEALT
jgi:hypothetical protein